MLNYIDDLRGWVPSKGETEAHFSCIQGTLEHLRLAEAKHKASPPSQVMAWLDLQFDITIIITIPQANRAEIATLVAE